MLLVTALGAKNLLNSMDGISYLTDPSGVILGVGEKHWNSFVSDNNGDALTPNAVIGRNVFNYIRGEEVRGMYTDILHAITNKKNDAIVFPYRCDSPTIRRELKMSMTPVCMGEKISAILFQSQTLSESDRPPLNIFNFKPGDIHGGSKVPKIVKMCSYCHSIAKDIGGPSIQSTWIAPEEYYQQGGESDVQVSHGMCPSCFENMSGAIEDGGRSGHTQASAFAT